MSTLRAISLITLLLLLLSCGRQEGKERKEKPRTDHVDTEQMIVDRLYMLSRIAPSQRKENWKDFAEGIGENSDRTVVDYLGNPDSPLYSPELLDEYLETLTELFPDSSSEHQRALYLIKKLEMNRPGEPIADLRLWLGETETTLMKLISGREGETIVFFYDPECESCDAMIESLERRDGKQENIIAVNVTGEKREERRAGRDRKLPSSWMSTRVVDSDELDERFYIPYLPSVYVVAADGIIWEIG